MYRRSSSIDLLFVKLFIYIEQSVDIDIFDKRQSLKASIHDTKGSFWL